MLISLFQKTAAASRPTFADRGNLISPEKLSWLRHKKSKRFQEAEPFPHLVVDDFLEPEMLDAVVEEFVSIDQSVWHSARSDHELKLSLSDESLFGPVTRNLLYSLNSSMFLVFLEKLTGISALISDPHFRGGGLPRIERGGKLGVHADFTYYRRLKLYRRLNVLVYLNRDWKKAWGGHLELWDATQCRKRVIPLFNRMVVFETSPVSFHGHPEPLECPAGESRKSLALYYYSVDYPYQEDMEPHTTVFVHDDD